MLHVRRSATICALRPLPASTIRSRPPNGPGAARGFAVAAEFKAALLRFRELNRHPLVPLKFEVPAAAADGSEEWPAECAGMRLGAQAGRYRQQWRRGVLSSADESELEGMGFAFDHNEWRWHGRVQPALTTYKEVHGDSEVPIAFVVPSSAPWAEETWGMRLGSVVDTIRSQGIYLKGEDAAERRTWLDEMGFVWD